MKKSIIIAALALASAGAHATSQNPTAKEYRAAPLYVLVECEGGVPIIDDKGNRVNTTPDSCANEIDRRIDAHEVSQVQWEQAKSRATPAVNSYMLAQRRSAESAADTLAQAEAATGTTAADSERARADKMVAAAQLMEAAHPYRLNGLTAATTIANW